jgi:hypothetical protein
MTDRLRHQLVELMPAVIEEGVLYISLEYLTVVHRCACGCGERVVTPIGPTDWSVTFHGDSASLHPSIGNWGLACSSHYIVRRGRVEWAERWSQERIAAGRRADYQAKVELFENTSTELPTERGDLEPISDGRKSWWRRVLGRTEG